MAFTYEEFALQAGVTEDKRTDFAPRKFGTSIGGYPSNNLDLPIVDSEYSESKHIMGQKFYAGSITMICRSTGYWDADGMEIFEHENGEIFVKFYRPPTPSDVDDCQICHPCLESVSDY